MPTASGSIAFLGAARFQGFWNAETNKATGSALAGAVATTFGAPGTIVALFATGSSTSGGYSNFVEINSSAAVITASAGDYWQVTGSGTHNVDGHTAWSLNDWCIY